MKKPIDTQNESGQTALMVACQKKDYATIELLVEAGADVNAVDEEGNTAIILAISSVEEDVAPKKEFSPFIFKVYFNFSLLSLFSDLPILVSVFPEC